MSLFNISSCIVIIQSSYGEQFGFLLVLISISHIFYGWFLGVDKKKTKLILVEASTICRALWLSRNDLVFDKSPSISYMQVIFRAMHWLRFWAQLQRCEDDGEFLMVACRKLESTVMQLFANYGWRFTNRLQ